MYPETFFHNLHNRIRKEWRFAFSCAFCVGLLVHLYRLTNHLLTWDSVYNFYATQNKPELGRCFLTFTCGLSSYYDIQWVNGLLSLLYLSLSCVCLTEIFSLQKKIPIFLISAITVTFPSVASTFAYMYTADGYFLAMLFVTLAILLTLRYQWGFLPGLVLIAVSYGSYQAYISYGIMLILTWTILQLLSDQKYLREIFSHWIRFLLMGGLGTLLYLGCSRVLSAIQHISASDYNGIGSMSLPNGPRLINAVKNCLIDFAYFFFGPLDRINLFKILNIALLLFLVVLFLRLICHNRLYRCPGRFLWLLLCLAAMPFVCFMIYFLSPEVRYYMLMYGSFSLIYMLPALICDKTEELSCKTLFLSWGSLLLTSVTIFNFALTANISYLYMTASNEKTFQLVSRMADRIEQSEDFRSAKRLCLIGHFDDYDKIALTLPPAMAGVRESYFISETAHFSAMLDTYWGLSLKNCSREEAEQLKKTEPVASMPCWPHKESVCQIDDIIVIKISDQEKQYEKKN